jgi:hypothetical protein
VLFDGEEPAQGLPEEQAHFYNTSGRRGSRAYVAAHPSRHSSEPSSPKRFDFRLPGGILGAIPGRT